MTLSRRGFLTAGAVTAGVVAGAGVDQAMAAPITGGRSVLDFGVQQGTEASQTAALQKAIDEIARSGHPVFFPAGRYFTDALKIPARCAITGVPGASVLHAKEADAVLLATGSAMFTLSGLGIDGGAGKGEFRPGKTLIAVSGATVCITHCFLLNAPDLALRLEQCSGMLQAVQINSALGKGIWATEVTALTVNQCRIRGCELGNGIRVTSGKGLADGSLISQNHVAMCHGGGIAVEGNAVVTGNFVSDAVFGLKLGGGVEGHIMATGNLLRECGVGIGVTASGETIFASLNLIHAPKEGGIRAFDGEKLLGPDLVRQSAESYLNLTVAGNVVR